MSVKKPVKVINDNGKFDLDRRRPYIIDHKTRNLSFLQTAMDLASLDIRHNNFMLALFDRSLVGLDPYSPFLTAQQQGAIINECYINPWYFLREVVRIPDQGGQGGVPYQLNRANLASTWLYLLNIDHYLVIPRQTGKTISTVAILLWSFLFGTSSSEFMFINKSAEDAVNNLGRLKTLREALPQYLRFNEIIDADGRVDKGKDNVKTVISPVTKNKIVTKPSAASVYRADNIGRGNTQPIRMVA